VIAAVTAAIAGICAAAGIIELLATERGRLRPRRAAAPPSRLAAVAVRLARLARRPGVRAEPGGFDGRIAAAGTPLGLAAGEVMALKAVAALGGLLVAVPAVQALPSRLAFAALVAAPVGGFLAPELALRRRVRVRRKRVVGELADVAELLRVAVAAGLPADRAIGEVGRRLRGVLPGELAAAAARLELGVARGEVLRELTVRCPGEGVAALVAAIARSDRHGAPLAPALAALAADARAEQARGLRDAAARAAPKIQLVVALVLVPSAMLVVGAVLLQSLHS
jgi:tight adherence protein C